MVTWFNCDEPPWDTTTLREFDFRETFVLVDCSDQPTNLEIRVVRNEEPIKRSVKMRKQSGMAHLNNVNIMLLELGPVSLQYTDRHLPKTRELLKRYRINRNDGNEFECTCINSPADELCGIVNTSVGDICNDIKMFHHGLRLETIRPVSRMAYWCPRRDLNLLRMPWLFGCYGHKRLHNFFRRGILLRLFSVCHTMYVVFPFLWGGWFLFHKTRE